MRIIPFILLLITSIQLNSKTTLDSLVDELEISKQDSAKAEIMIQIAIVYCELDTNIAINYINKAIELSERKGLEKYKYKSKSVIGNLKCNHLNYEEALLHWKDAHQIALSLNIDNLILESYEKLGEINKIKGDFDNATMNFIRALEFANEKGMEVGAAKINIKLAQLNYFLENYDNSIMYLSNSLETYLGIEDYFMLASIRLELGKVYLALEDDAKAYENLLAASKLDKYIKDTKELALIYRYMGIVLYRQRNFKESLDYLISAYSLALTFKDIKLLAEVNYDLGKLFNLRGDYDDAINHFMEGLQQVKQLGARSIELAIYRELSIAYSNNKDFENAYSYQLKYSVLREELFSVDKTKIITNAMTKYQSEKVKQENEILQKQVQIEQLERQQDKYVIFIIIGLAFAAIVIAILLFYSNKRKQKVNEQLEKNNQLIENQKSQMEELNVELHKRNEEIEKINDNLIKSGEELKELNATKDKFFSIIAHDLKNPITGFMVSSDLLVNYYEKLDKDQILKKINELSLASKHIRTLLDNLLKWSRTQTGQISYDPEKVKLANIVNNIIGLLKTSADNKSIKIITNVDEDILAYVDEQMIETVIRNLVSNAIKFTPDNGEIHIEAVLSNDRITLHVNDNGVGIPKDKIENLFDVTRNYTSLGTNSEKGTGLGLILCKEFVETNQGSISVISKKGEGTTFTLDLPGCDGHEKL